jgi:hypothetical protein
LVKGNFTTLIGYGQSFAGVSTYNWEDVVKRQTYASSGKLMLPVSVFARVHQLSNGLSLFVVGQLIP